MFRESGGGGSSSSSDHKSIWKLGGGGGGSSSNSSGSCQQGVANSLGTGLGVPSGSGQASGGGSAGVNEMCSKSDTGSNASTSGGSSKSMGTLSLDRAAFLLIRIKRVFHKRKHKSGNPKSKQTTSTKKGKPPLLRARTLPAIITPSLNIIQAQLDPNDPSGGVKCQSGKGLFETNSYGSKRSSCGGSVSGSSSSGLGVGGYFSKPDNQIRFSLLVDEDDQFHQPFSSSSTAAAATTTSQSSHFYQKGSNKSPSLSPRHSVSSTSSTGSTTGKIKSAGFSKIARLLSQPKEPKVNVEKLIPSPVLPNSDSIVDVSCFSWNRNSSFSCERFGGHLKKSGSIDSLLEVSQGNEGNQCPVAAGAGNSSPFGALPPHAQYPQFHYQHQHSHHSYQLHHHQHHGINISISEANDSPPVSTLDIPGQCCTLTGIAGEGSLTSEMQRCKSGTVLPSSPSFNKLQRSISGKRQESMDYLFPEGISLNKSERKRLERLNKFNFDLQALFAAVEREQLDRAKTLLESTDVDVNSVNSDGFTPLDIAVMTLNISMVKVLQSYGAKESNAFSHRESRERQLNCLLREAEQSLMDISGCVLSATTNGSLSAGLLKEKERQKMLWERRLCFLKRIKSGFNQLKIPDPLSSVYLDVVGSSSIKVKFLESKTANYKDKLVTKYRVEWSESEDYSLSHYLEVTDLQKLNVVIDGLKTGQRYYVRVAAGNVKGYSEYRSPDPSFVIPSSWRDIDSKEARFQRSLLLKLDTLFQHIINSRPEHSAEVKGLTNETIEAASQQPQQQQRKGQMRKSIKHLFAPAPKFQKSMKRGVYLTCLFYNEDRILVTTDDNLPIVEVDDTYPSASLHSEFHWIMKVACTWDDVKALRLELEKSQSSSSSHFRSKFLQAIEHLQAALGLQDLGQLYYQPIKDGEGTIAICSVKHVPDLKSVSSLSVRWIPLTKVMKKVASTSLANNSSSSPENSDSSVSLASVNDLLHSSLQDIILYNKASRHPLQRGLYLGYVKLKSSVDLISVVVPRLMPNILPHIRIRENPHVSQIEWQTIKNYVNNSTYERQFKFDTELSEVQTESESYTHQCQSKFLQSLSQAFRHLSLTLELSEKEISSHRLFDVEVIELNGDVSFILLLPPVESVCLVPGQSDALTDNQNFIQLPVQIFEMVHLNTYQPTLIARFSRVSSILEMDTMVAQQAQREAFSSSEMTTAKDRLSQLHEFQSKLDEAWRSMRWIMDVINYARDKSATLGVPLSTISVNFPSSEDLNEEPESPKLMIPSIYLQPAIHLQPPSGATGTIGERGGGGGASTLTSGGGKSSEPGSGYVPQRRPSRDDSTIGLSTTGASGGNFLTQLRIQSSVSTYSLLDVIHASGGNYSSESVSSTDLQPSGGEIRRCASTSRLAHGTAPNSVDNSDRDELDVTEEEELNRLVCGEGGVGGDGFGGPTSYSRGNSLDISVEEFQADCCQGEDESRGGDEDGEDNEAAAEGFETGKVNSNSEETQDEESEDLSPDIIRVFAAYECGAPKGTSVKVRLLPQTTAKDVIEIVVRQFNIIVKLKQLRAPVYTRDQMDQFKLTVRTEENKTVVIPENLKLSHLEEPLRKGRFYVKSSL